MPTVGSRKDYRKKNRELDRLSDLVIEYEDEHYPMDDPNPHSMLEFMLDQQTATRVQLINVQGDSEEVERYTPTILVLGVGLSRGIGYIDPELLPADAINHGRDQVTVNRTPVNELFRAEPEYLLRCDVPVNPGMPDNPAGMPTAISLTTSTY